MRAGSWKNGIQVSEEVHVEEGPRTPTARSKGRDGAESEVWIIHPESKMSLA